MMNRSNAPSPIRTSVTPTAAGAGGGGGGFDFPNNTRDVQDFQTNTVSSHEQQLRQHYYNESNTKIPAASSSSSLRQGRFLSSPEHSGNGSSSAHHYQQQQKQQQQTSPTQVTFQPGAAPPQPITVASAHQFSHSPANHNNTMTANNNFMFEEIENIQHEFMAHPDSPPFHNNSNNSSSSSDLPTEAQLTLLCLDYLRSLRRSYQNPQDLLNGEGLHADYLSLAIWSLSRAFVSPNKLKFGTPKLSTIIEEYGNDSKKTKNNNKKKRVKEIQLVGGGGLSGGVEDECVGNDSFYRLVKQRVRNSSSSISSGNDDFTATEMMTMNNNNNNNRAISSPKEIFALTENIKLPSMKDITNEVLLSYNNDDNDEVKDDDECPVYEQNDMHLSNSHRFYLFNGMASGDDSMGMMGANAIKELSSPKGTTPSIIDSGPLTLVELTTVALSTLNARSRIEAEREVVQDPLFESFINAASEKGFFNEKKLDDELLSPEEEEYRQRLLYENKYRKVVAKFRSKLAVREEQQMLNHGGGGYYFGGGGGWSPRSGQRALLNVLSVSDRLEMRRDRIIEQVKEYRVEEDEEEDASSFVPHLLLEQPDGGVVRANYGQVIPHRSESDEGIQSNVMMERVMKEVEGAPSSPSPSKAPTDPPPSTGMAKKVPPSPAAKLPFYQGAERLNAQGNELMQKKQFNQALELYTAALKISPAGPNSHVYYSNRAAAKLSLGDAESSIQDSISALTIRPDYVKAHTRLGLAHFASGRYDEAVANYKTALDLEPENEWVKSQYEKARKMLVMNEEEEDKVLTATKDKEDDGWPSPFVNKDEEAKDIIFQADEYEDNGNAYMKKKKYEEALHQSNIAIDPSVRNMCQEAERLNAQGNELMQKKQFNQALELYTAALKISPAVPNSHVYYANRAAAKLSLGDVESSIQDSTSALTIRPDYVKAHTRLGLAHFASGRYDEAVANYKTALDLEPENEWVKSQYEKARKMLVMNEEEEDKVLTATKDKEDDGWPSPFVNKEEEAKDIIRQADEYKDNGNVYMKKKKYEEALHQYNLAIDTSANGPNSHIYYSNRAAAYCYLGQYSEAAKDCLASIELDDSYEKAYARYGLSLFFLGDYEGSINAYKKSLDLAPDNKASLSYLAKAEARLAEQQENEMQEEMAKKLNLGKMQETLGVGNDELDQEIEQNEHYEGIAALHTELSQSRDDEGEGVVGQTVKAMDPFDTDEGDEI